MIQRNESLDSLRGLCAIYVIAFHSYFTTRGVTPWLHSLFSLGDIAVSIFFLISGFLVLSSHSRHIKEESKFNSNFYIRRWFRIIPLWWLVVTISFFLADFPIEVLIVNVTFIFGFIAYNPMMLPIYPAWSLFVEEVFYLFFPLLCKARRRVNPFFLFIGFYIISVVWLKFAPLTGVPTSNFFIYRSPFAKFQYFILGFILHDIYNHHDTLEKIQKNNRGYIFTPLDFVTLLSFICIFLETYILVELVVFLVALAVLTPNTLLSRISNIRILKWAGVRCYFIYIAHSLIIPFSRRYVMSSDHLQTFSINLKVTIFFILTLTTTALLAAISFRFFEKPLINLGERLIQRRERNLLR